MTPRLGSAVLALAIGLGSPAWAAKVYVPHAVNQEDRGAFQRTELLLSNGQPSLAQTVSYRLLTEGLASGAKSIELAGGKSLKIAAPVALGGRGLLEVDVPLGVSVSARLVVTRPGADPVSTSVPVLDERAAFVADAQAKLQGLAHVEGLNKTALGLINLGSKAASCSISVTDAEGNTARRGSVEFALASHAQGYQENLFDLFGARAPELAVATVSCNQKFWTYAVVTDDASGAAQFVSPSVESVVQTLGSGTQASIIFALPGTYLTCTKYNHNWNYNMRFPTTLSFRQVKLDYDVYVGNWDSANPGGTHCLFWLEKGTSWATMFGYANALGGSKNINRIKILNGTDAFANSSPSVKPGNNYHVKYAYDLIGKRTGWEVRRKDGVLITSKWFSRSESSFSAKSFFVQFGTQNGEGPEARTYGWKFSNLKVEYVP